MPFVERQVTAEPIAFFRAPDAPARSAIRFVNTTGQTLPAGTLAVFEGAGFAGETSLDRAKPGEQRFLQFGNELDAEVTPKASRRKEESKRLTFERSQLAEHFVATTDLTWELENRGGSARVFYVTVDAIDNGQITGADRVDFDPATAKPVAVFDVPAKTKVVRSFRVTEGLSRAHAMELLGGRMVTDLLARTTIAPGDLALLAQAEPRVRALEAEIARTAEAERLASAATSDLERLREHMKALGGGEKAGGAGSAAAPLVKRLLEAEDRLEAARRRSQAAAREVTTKSGAVREVLAKLGAS